jgi:hypothetical protein
MNCLFENIFQKTKYPLCPKPSQQPGVRRGRRQENDDAFLLLIGSDFGDGGARRRGVALALCSRVSEACLIAPTSKDTFNRNILVQSFPMHSQAA